MNKIIKKEIIFGGKRLSFETGELANQANLAVKATYGDTVILTTVVSGKSNPDLDFFPLTINYEERLYASGSIKTSKYIKRDGRSTDDAIVARRAVDHAVRPLFPNDYMDEVQVVNTVMSLDNEADPEFLTMISTSACLFASNVPWGGPMTSARVGYIDGNYVLNPSLEDLHEKSELDMMVSFSGDDMKFLAVEAEANVLPESKILGAIEFASSHLKPVLQLIKDFAKEVNPTNSKYTYVSRKLSDELLKDVEGLIGERVVVMMGQGFDKTKIKEEQEKLKAELLTTFEGKYKKSDLNRAFEELEKHALQNLILKEKKRPDGRGITEIRQLSASVGVLPRTHGSGLFTRGVTQVLTVATLGSPSNELVIEDMYGADTKRYLHFYNFPPYSTGETGRIGTPGSREVGHGMLAERALRPVLPDQKDFPYMIVLVSETLGSSGSSSMAATCGSTLALMDAGVPIKDIVAGVGVGLIVNDDETEHLIMTDLAYMEDAFGFMDFKMTGTTTGVTAMQVDMKMQGIPMSLLPKIMEQSHDGRMVVLEKMKETIAAPRATVSQYAPKTVGLKIDPEKIGIVIGSGGKTIKEIQAKTGAEISIEDDGTVVITAVNAEKADEAAKIVEGLVKDVKRGEVYDGVVEEVVDFGAFVNILPGKTGLLHISEISNEYVSSASDYLHAGDIVKVKVLDVESNGKISLSKKILEPGYNGPDVSEGDGGHSDRPRRPMGGGRGGPRGGDHGGRGGDRGGRRDSRDDRSKRHPDF